MAAFGCQLSGIIGFCSGSSSNKEHFVWLGIEKAQHSQTPTAIWWIPGVRHGCAGLSGSWGISTQNPKT